MRGKLRGIGQEKNTTKNTSPGMKGVLMMNEEGLNSSGEISRCGNWKRVCRYSRGATGDLGTWRRRGKIQGGTRENSGAGRKLGIQGGTGETQMRVRIKQKSKCGTEIYLLTAESKSPVETANLPL